MNDAAWARTTAEQLLSQPLPQRWAHTQGVAERARLLVPILGNQADLLEAAAWLHDIGYSPQVADTGFHPLDGARYLRDVENVDQPLGQLVAHHSYAIIEAETRGLGDTLADEFDVPPAHLGDALTYCDMTTDPTGAPTSVEERLADVLARYGGDHVVRQFVEIAKPYIVETVHRISASLLHPERARPSTR